jgi:hypothetical protein
MVSEQDFQLISGNRYRGSRYSNFTGGGIDAQGNTSSAINENAISKVGTSSDVTDITGGAGAVSSSKPSSGLLSTSTSSGAGAPVAGGIGAAAKGLAIGGGVPMAASSIGRSVGQAVASGTPVGSAFSSGISDFGNRVSGGLIGSAATPTNSALAGMGGKFGPATASSVSKAASGGSIGGAVGSGLGTAAATLLGGGSVKDAAVSGVGSAVGTAIGNAVLPGIGGFIGGFLGGNIGKIFCFAAGTQIVMEDGSLKNIEDLRMGDRVHLGGAVICRGESLAEDLYFYMGSYLTGSHAIFENGRWLRARDSELARPVELSEEHTIVYPVGTENMLLCTPMFISADVIEVPNHGEVNDEGALVSLNEDTERNQFLQFELIKLINKDKNEKSAAA